MIIQHDEDGKYQMINSSDFHFSQHFKLIDLDIQNSRIASNECPTPNFIARVLALSMCLQGYLKRMGTGFEIVHQNERILGFFINQLKRTKQEKLIVVQHLFY